MGSPWQPLSPKDLHRPILATSSSFNTAARSSASSAASPTADRRRVGSGSSASGQGPADDRPVSGEGGSGGGAKKSPSIPLAPLDKGKGKAVVDHTLPATKARERKVPLGRVLEDVLKSANGRDKVFKTIQYSIKIYLVFHTFRGHRPTPLRVRLKSTQSAFSLARRTFLLLNFLGPLNALASPSSLSFLDILPTSIDFTAALSDDIYTLHRMGLVGQRLGDKAERWANRFWLLTTLISLSHLSVSTPALTRRIEALEHARFTASGGLLELPSGSSSQAETDKLKAERDEERWTALKLWMDLVFVLYDIMDWKTFRDPVQAFTGFVAACIGTRKLLAKHRTALLKSA